LEFNTVSDFVEMIANTGIMVVCSAMLLICFIIMFKTQQKHFDLLFKKISKGNHPEDDDIEFLDKINERIYVELRGLVDSLQADRAYVFLYHNGGISSSGLYFQKMSCISEVVSTGVLPMLSETQNIHRSSYTSLCSSLKDSYSWSLLNVKDLEKEDPFLYQRLRYRHTYSMMVRAITNSNNQVIGFLGLDYCSYNSYDFDNIDKVLKNVSHRISVLVDVRSQVDK